MLRLALLVPLSACFTMRVETMSHPEAVQLRMSAPCDDVVLEHYVAGEYREIAIEDGIANVDVPAMQGGYSERGGKRSNVHEPRDYPVLRLRRGELVVRELSLNQVDALPKGADGRSVVGCG